jgi:heat-inducible transcriptional repressor
VPTDSGYRAYVDQLLGARARARTLPDVEALRQPGTVGDLLEQASQELSRASHQIGFAIGHSNPSMRLHHVDFVDLDGGRVLVIVVATGGQITHKVVEPAERCDPTFLTQAANYVNTEFAGLTLHEARAAIVERLRQERSLYDELSARALRLARSGLSDIASQSVHVQGTAFLVDGLAEESADPDRTLGMLRALVRMVEEKHRLIEILTKYIDAHGLTVVIGSENALPDLHPFSVVASTFRDGERSGTVGVIGPTRMRYHRAIAAVDRVSQTMARVLEETGPDDTRRS